MPEEAFPNLIGVKGNLVIVGDSTVIDLTTDAMTTMPDDAPPVVAAGQNLLVTTSRTAAGHWDADGYYWIDPVQQVTVTKLADLPYLDCG